MSIEKLKEYIAKYGHNDKLLTDAILELAEQVEKESKGMTEIYDHHEARFRIIAEKIDEMQEQITELNNRLDVR